MSYAPLDQDQPDSYCCVPTTASMIVDHSTAGNKRPAVEALRRATGIPHPFGISYLAIEDAVKEVANVDLAPRYGLTRGEVAALAPAGRTFGISVEMSRIGYSASGGHTIYVNDYSVWPGGGTCSCEKRSSLRHSEFTIQDPGTWTVGYKQISAERLFGAAEARTGGHGINVIVGLDTEGVYRKCVAAGFGRAKATTSSGKTRTLVVGRKYLVREIMNGQPWWRKDGSRSAAWYRTGGGDFIRGDKLGTANV